MAASNFIQKLKRRGISWLIARLWLESHFYTKKGKMLKPLMYFFYFTFMLPLNKYKAKKIKKNYHNPNNLRSLYLFYDLEVSPISYDLAFALTLAEFERIKQQLDDIQVIFVPGKKQALREEDEHYAKKVSIEERLWRRHEILYNLCELLPTCRRFMLCENREEAQLFCEKNRPNIFPKNYTVLFPITHTLADQFRDPIKQQFAPGLRATPQSLYYIQQWLNIHLKKRKLITITLRETHYQRQRNSNLLAWINFAKQLDPKEYFVVFIPDTQTALLKKPACLNPFTYFTEPCWNIHLRAALYETSYLNLGVNNGPMAICWLNSKCRYLTFKILTPEIPEATESRLNLHGFFINQSPPFAQPFQKWVWKNDDADSIFEEFNLMCRLIET